MPHLTLEYTANLRELPVDQLLLALNRTLLASGQFAEPDIKSRAHVLDHYLIGTSGNERAFVHVRLALLSGRPPAVKQTLSAQLLATLHQAWSWPALQRVQLSVELCDLDGSCYLKENF